MSTKSLRATRLLAAAAIVITLDASSASAAKRPKPMPAFSLKDVNAKSPSFGTSVSRKDLGGMASAWYFGHST